MILTIVSPTARKAAAPRLNKKVHFLNGRVGLEEQKIILFCKERVQRAYSQPAACWVILRGGSSYSALRADAGNP